MSDGLNGNYRDGREASDGCGTRAAPTPDESHWAQKVSATCAPKQADVFTVPSRRSRDGATSSW